MLSTSAVCKPMLGSPCEQVATTTSILHALVGLTFHTFDDNEVSSPQGLGDSAWCMKPKVQGDRRAEEVIDVDDLVAHMERNQCQPPRRQYPPELKHDSVELGGIEMHDRIERNEPCKARSRQAELPDIAHAEVETRVEARGALDHLRRDINSDNGHSLIVQISRDVSRATAKIGDEPPTACVLGEPIQEMPVERLLSQLRGQMLGVGFGCRIVTFTNIHNASGLDPKCAA